MPSVMKRNLLAIAAGVVIHYAAASPIALQSTPECHNAMLACESSVFCEYVRCVDALEGCTSFHTAEQSLECKTPVFTPTSEKCTAAFDVCQTKVTSSTALKAADFGADLQALADTMVVDGKLNIAAKGIEYECQVFEDIHACVMSENLSAACSADEGFTAFRASPSKHSSLIKQCHHLETSRRR